MKITYDPNKREKTLAERGLDFLDAPLVFANPVHQFEDIRRDYGEQRMICYGILCDRLVVVGYVQRGETRHIFTMRKANEREQMRYWERLGES
ncbi:MAG: BrnT family toxin [Magnetococcales bacterium]|nr:BrnT family toxin [Magnetococcales bacterium]